MYYIWEFVSKCFPIDGFYLFLLMPFYFLIFLPCFSFEFEGYLFHLMSSQYLNKGWLVVFVRPPPLKLLFFWKRSKNKEYQTIMSSWICVLFDVTGSSSLVKLGNMKLLELRFFVKLGQYDNWAIFRPQCSGRMWLKKWFLLLKKWIVLSYLILLKDSFIC